MPSENSRCWWHIADDAERCPNAAKWKSNPTLIASDSTAAAFLSACVWCDEHKHDDDIPIEES